VSGRNQVVGAEARYSMPRGGEPGSWVVDREVADGSHEHPAPRSKQSPADVDVGPMPRQLLTQREFAALLQVDERTVRTWRHEGLVPKPVQLGRVLRWRRRDVEQWIEGLTP